MKKKCALCGKVVVKKGFTYCPDCGHFLNRPDYKHLSIEEKQSIVRYVHEHGFVDFYTHLPLEMKNPKSPWYCVFDHWIPGDKRRIVLTSLINDMKTELSAAEFWYYVEQLYNFKTYGTPIKKRELKYWQGFYRVPEPAQGVPMQCCICRAPFIRSSNQIYCPMCAVIVHRMCVKGFPAATREEVLNYIREHGYVCSYTEMPLDRDPRSPWYAVLDHWIPGDPRKVMLTSALFNSMKSDLTEDEFWYYIEQLYKHYKEHKKIIKKDPVYWVRLFPKVKSLGGDV